MICSLFFYIASADYTTEALTLTFNPNNTCVDIPVPIIDDEICEDDEMFFGEISNPSDSDVTLNPTTATVTIMDNEGIQ